MGQDRGVVPRQCGRRRGQPRPTGLGTGVRGGSGSHRPRATPEVREVYLVHDGHGSPPGLFGIWELFLGLAAATDVWRLYQDLARSLPAMPNSVEAWREQVAKQMTFIKGPFKPHLASPAWFPVTDANGAVLRFLDFDPAPGGREGQVIEVDLESSMYQVVAESLLAFLEAYADELERGEMVVEGGDLRRRTEPEIDPAGWGMPDYLR